mmetsp:Transcript_27242/g.52506  ORF Transcript_27242/g.52506 Transcript_27242/m.52506 type:complete len:642 (-) Transcript_27242:39-1964(-)
MNGGLCNEGEGKQRQVCKLVECGTGKVWNPAVHAEHRYVIKVAGAALYMHAPGRGYRLGTKNILDDCSATGNSPSCQWVLEPSLNEPGHFYIKVGDGVPLYLLSKGGTGDGKNSELGNCPQQMNLRNCQWILEPSLTTPGYYYIQSSDANLYLRADTLRVSTPIVTGACKHEFNTGCQWRFEDPPGQLATQAAPETNNTNASASGQVSTQHFPKPMESPLNWHVPLVEVTCKFTADGMIGRVNYDDKDLTALVTAVTRGWSTTKSLKFFEKPGAVLTIEGVSKHRVQGCLNTGIQVACTANSTKSVWHKMTSNSTQWSATGRAHGKFTASELHGRGSWAWDRPCEARSTHLHLVEAPAVKKLWAVQGTKYALIKFPTWGQVVCKFMLDDHLESVFYNGQDITAKVTAFTSEAKRTKVIRFQEEPHATLTIEGRSGEKSRIGRCAKSGLQIVCAASVTGSLWNGVDSNKGWKVKGSLKGNFDAESVKGHGKSWFWPCKSRRGKKLQGAPNLKKIWAPLGDKYALFKYPDQVHLQKMRRNSFKRFLKQAKKHTKGMRNLWGCRRRRTRRRRIWTRRRRSRRRRRLFFGRRRRSRRRRVWGRRRRTRRRRIWARRRRTRRRRIWDRRRRSRRRRRGGNRRRRLR